MRRIPHPLPYQGSKRLLASVVLRHFPKDVRTLIEPFAGSAAITLAAASRSMARRFLFGDVLKPLVSIWKMVIDDPKLIADQYEQIWKQQRGRSAEHFLEIRDRFNRTEDPACLLYLLARCVKNAVRFNTNGEFNQSADHRRKGMHPDKMRQNILGASALLQGQAQVQCADYCELTRRAAASDLVYMDPPYQGVSGTRNPRYHSQVDFHELVNELERMNRRGIRYLLSYDGACGGIEYGKSMPKELGLIQMMIRVGRSAQATLSGRRADTVESLYVSPSLAKQLGVAPTALCLKDPKNQLTLY